MTPDEYGDMVRSEARDRGQKPNWKTQPCKMDELAVMLNEIEEEGREVFSVLALSNAFALVISRAKPKAQSNAPAKKGRK